MVFSRRYTTASVDLFVLALQVANADGDSFEIWHMVGVGERISRMEFGENRIFKMAARCSFPMKK